MFYYPGDNTEAINEDGFLIDVDVQSIEDTTRKRCTDKTADVTAFFGKPCMVKSKDGKSRNVRDCDLCRYVVFAFMLAAPWLISITGNMAGPMSLSLIPPHAVVT